MREKARERERQRDKSRERHRERETDRQTDRKRQTDRQTDRDKSGESERKKERERERERERGEGKKRGGGGVVRTSKFRAHDGLSWCTIRPWYVRARVISSSTWSLLQRQDTEWKSCIREANTGSYSAHKLEEKLLVLNCLKLNPITALYKSINVQ